MYYIHGVPVYPNNNYTRIPTGEPTLFLNNKFIASASNLERIWYSPEKSPLPVMVADKPWEKEPRYECVGGFSGKSIVVKKDRIEMFYSVYHMHDKYKEYRDFAYAYSNDGLKWIKPEIQGKTNLLFKNARQPHGKVKLPYYEMQSVTWDEHRNRYICMGHCVLANGKVGTFYGYSINPKKWDPNTFKLAYGNEDIHSLMGWDSSLHSYVSYPRVLNLKAGRVTRAIGRSLSPDFRHWSNPIQCFEANPLDYHMEIYNMPVVKRGGYYLGFPILYQFKPYDTCPLSTYFAFSEDGTMWTSIQGMQFIPRGVPGSWDDCYAMTAAPVEYGGDTLFYYWGCDFPHDYGFGNQAMHRGSVGLAVLAKDRYCSLACSQSGQMGRLAITAERKEAKFTLVLNARIKGVMKVLCGASKVELKAQDSVEIPVEINSTETFINIWMADAELFSVELRE
jgi:hypothetical protein